MPKTSRAVPKLWVPKTTSYDGYTKRGYVQNGTKAFVLQGTRLPRGLKREEKRQRLSLIASKAKYFIKPLSARNKKIRTILQKYGVRVEKVMQELGLGKALFEKEGYGLNSPRGVAIFRKNPVQVTERLINTVAKMTLLEVYHGHPHLGNFAVTKTGEIIVLDLGKATMGKPESIRQREITSAEKQKMANDLNAFCHSLTLYSFRKGQKKEPSREEYEAMHTRLWNALHDTMEKIRPAVEMEIKQNNQKLRKKS